MIVDTQPTTIPAAPEVDQSLPSTPCACEFRHEVTGEEFWELINGITCFCEPSGNQINNEFAFNRIEQAVELIHIVHQGETRKSDDGPYVERHLLPAACAFIQYHTANNYPIYLDQVLTVLCHDVGESGELEQVRLAFGDEVAEYVTQLTKPNKKELGILVELMVIPCFKRLASNVRADIYSAQLQRIKEPWLIAAKIIDNTLNLLDDTQGLEKGTRTPPEVTKYRADSKNQYGPIFGWLAGTIYEPLLDRWESVLAELKCLGEGNK